MGHQTPVNASSSSASSSSSGKGRRNSTRKARPYKPLDEFFHVHGVQPQNPTTTSSSSSLFLEDEITIENEEETSIMNRRAKKTREGPKFKWNCPACTYLNSPQCMKCQMCFTQWVPPSIWQPESETTGEATQPQPEQLNENAKTRTVQTEGSDDTKAVVDTRRSTSSAETTRGSRRTEAHSNRSVEVAPAPDGERRQEPGVSCGSSSGTMESSEDAPATAILVSATKDDTGTESTSVNRSHTHAPVISAVEGDLVESTPTKSTTVTEMRSRTSEQSSAGESQRSITPTQPYTVTPYKSGGVGHHTNPSTVLGSRTSSAEVSQRSITPTQAYAPTPHSDIKSNYHSMGKTQSSITPTQPYRDTPSGSGTRKNMSNAPSNYKEAAAQSTCLEKTSSHAHQCLSTHSSSSRQGRDLSDLIEAQKSLGFDLLGDSSSDEESDNGVSPEHKQVPAAQETTVCPSHSTGTTTMAGNIVCFTDGSILPTLSPAPAQEVMHEKSILQSHHTSNHANSSPNVTSTGSASMAESKERPRPEKNPVPCGSPSAADTIEDQPETNLYPKMNHDESECYGDMIDRKAQELLPHFSSIACLEELQENGFITMAIEYGSQFNSQKQSRQFSPQEIREAMRKLTEGEDTCSMSEQLRNVAEQQLQIMKQQRQGSRSKSSARRETKQNSRGKRGRSRGAGQQRGQGRAKRGGGGKNSRKASIAAMPVPKNSSSGIPSSTNPHSFAGQQADIGVHTTDHCYADDATGIQLCGYKDPLLADVPSSMWEMTGKTVYTFD
eukprot:gb/GECG01006990.1/.p1 GENE.gb/GECG01006990.1/~~gb/GECG01006990.1/.p1  ORF type:complete len:780 (+),score=90.03 gb/GECG01006990.1/:1-2340(+)